MFPCDPSLPDARSGQVSGAEERDRQQPAFLHLDLQREVRHQVTMIQIIKPVVVS